MAFSADFAPSFQIRSYSARSDLKQYKLQVYCQYFTFRTANTGNLWPHSSGHLSVRALALLASGSSVHIGEEVGQCLHKEDAP